MTKAIKAAVLGMVVLVATGTGVKAEIAHQNHIVTCERLDLNHEYAKTYLATEKFFSEQNGNRDLQQLINAQDALTQSEMALADNNCK